MSYKSVNLNTTKIKKLYNYVKKTKALVCHQHPKFEEPVLKKLGDVHKGLHNKAALEF